MRFLAFFPFIFCFLCKLALADLPLTLEDLLTDKGKLKLESSIAYVNSEQQKSTFANPILIQTGSASFVPVPTELQENQSNTDILLGSLGLRYGLTGKTDIYANTSYIWRKHHHFDGTTQTQNSNRNLSDVSIGISKTFLQDGKSPALIGFAETVLYEKSQGKASSGKSWLIGATTYKAIDPIVFSLTGAYRFNAKKKIHDGTYQAGNYFMLNPSVAFAANDKISLTGGIQWINAQPERLNGKQVSARANTTYAHAGIGVGISSKASVQASARFNVSGKSSTELKLGLSYGF